MASIHRVILRMAKAVQFWDFTELESQQPAGPKQQFNPYIC